MATTTPTATSHGHSRGDADDDRIDTDIVIGTPGEMGSRNPSASVCSRSSQPLGVEHLVDGPARYGGSRNR